MMESHIENRKHQISIFEKFLKDASSQIDKILCSVGWTRDHLENEESDMVHCPLNFEHRMPKTSLDEHIQSCLWRKGGYCKVDTPLPGNMSGDSDINKSSLILDSSLQASIIKQAKRECEFLFTGDTPTNVRPVPQTSNRLMSDFTPNERLALYDYVIANTRPAGDITVADVQMMGELKKNDTPRPKSKLELLIEQRDAKRRRISYRKKVHTNRKTQTEILREVIQNQMELLEQIIKGECDEETDKISCDEPGETVENGEVMPVGIEEKDNVDLVKSDLEEYERKYDGNYSRCYRDGYRRKSFERCEAEKERKRSRMRNRSRSRESKGWYDKKRSKNRYFTYEEERNRGESYYTHRKDFNKCKDNYRNEHRRREESYKPSCRNLSEEHKIDIESKNSRSSKYSPLMYQLDDDNANTCEENYKVNQYSGSKYYDDSHSEGNSCNFTLGKKKYYGSNVDKNKIVKLSPDQRTSDLQKRSGNPKKPKKKKSHKHKSKSKKKKKERKHLGSGASDSGSINVSDFSFSA